MIFLTWNNFTKWLEEHELPCMYKSLFGHECPGCGMQRAFVELLKGNFTDSIYIYPGLIPLILTLIFTLLQIIFKWEKGGKIIILSTIVTVLIILISFVVIKFI